MSNKFKYGTLILTALAIIALAVAALAASSAKAANTTYYVDCSAGSNGSGTQASPWNNLATVNATTFGAGDQILLKRGTTCVGQLWPKGSGVSGNPITVSAYGTGARPIIDGNNAVDIAVHLKDQSYWVIDSLEAKNSTNKGVYVDGSKSASLTYFRLTNLYVHNIGSGGIGTGDGQDAIIVGMYQNHSVHDVVIDNVETGYAFRGVEIGGPSPLAGSARSSDITIQNSIAYYSQNDGMLAASANNVVMQNNVVYESGVQATNVNHTPNGLWTWDCDNCVVQFSEVYTTHSPTWDGGAFDIDYFTHNNTVQYNYAHDNDAYCAAVFGGDRSDVTTNNIIRYNICSNNVRVSDQKATRQGELYLTIWSGGSVQDTYIYNNTVYFNPVASSLGPYYAINLLDIWHGTFINNTNIYNNIIYATDPHLVYVIDFPSETHMDYNLYWYTGAGNPSFMWDGTEYTSFAAWKAGSGQDAHSLYVDPLLNDPTYHAIGMPVSSFTLQSGSPAINAGVDLVALGKVASMGTRDFFGNAIPNGAYDIGAYEAGGAPQPTRTSTPVPPTPTITSTPTITPIPPTPTNTATPTITNTPGGPTPTRTNTPVPPTPTNTPSGSSNLALGKTVSVSSFQSGGEPAKAVDGSLTTYWRTTKGSTLTNEWIVVDLGSNTSISSVIFKWSTYWATVYNVQISTDNANWTTVFSTSSGDGGTDTITFASSTARYVRMYSTNWSHATERLRMFEFEIYQ